MDASRNYGKSPGNFEPTNGERGKILFLDKASIHPTSLVDKYSNIKFVFLPNNTTSRLQPVDAGIIQSFKSKYRKKLMRYVTARVKEDFTSLRNCDAK